MLTRPPLTHQTQSVVVRLESAGVTQSFPPRSKEPVEEAGQHFDPKGFEMFSRILSCQLTVSAAGVITSASVTWRCRKNDTCPKTALPFVAGDRCPSHRGAGSSSPCQSPAPIQYTLARCPSVTRGEARHQYAACRHLVRHLQHETFVADDLLFVGI